MGLELQSREQVGRFHEWCSTVSTWSAACDPFYLHGDDQREREAVEVEEGKGDKW